MVKYAGVVRLVPPFLFFWLVLQAGKAKWNNVCHLLATWIISYLLSSRVTWRTSPPGRHLHLHGCCGWTDSFLRGVEVGYTLCEGCASSSCQTLNENPEMSFKSHLDHELSCILRKTGYFQCKDLFYSIIHRSILSCSSFSKKKMKAKQCRVLPGVTRLFRDPVEATPQPPDPWSYFLPLFLEFPFPAIK